MNRRNLPFNALRAFEAAARNASVSGAASELSVTHSAISHQLKQLEQVLGIKLLHRTNRGIKTTSEGDTLLSVLLESFNRISTTLDDLQNHKQKEAIHVTCTPSFASKWLVPRLADWYAREDASQIHLQPNLNYLDFKLHHIDIAIRCGIPPWEKLEHELLVPIHLVPVCSPEYLNRIERPENPENLLACDFIHADVGGHGIGEEWCDWLTGCGLECPKIIDGLSFHDPALAMQAAADGLGLAIGYQELIKSDLVKGKLVTVFDQAVKHSCSYYLVYKKSNLEKKTLMAFRNWLIEGV